MARKFRVGHIVRVKETARKDLANNVPWFKSARWYGVIIECLDRTEHPDWPYHIAAGKRGKGDTWVFSAAELDLVERPKPQKGV